MLTPEAREGCARRSRCLAYLLYGYKRTNTDAAAAAAAAGLVANTAEQLQMMHEEWAEASRSELRFMLRIFRQAIMK